MVSSFSRPDVFLQHPHVGHHGHAGFRVRILRVRRFKDEPEISQYLETKKIFADHPPYHQVHRALVEYYRSLIPSSEDYFLAPFSIKSGSNIYGVIFGSRSYHKGLQKFLETAWSFDMKNRGEADFDIDREGHHT